MGRLEPHSTWPSVQGEMEALSSHGKKDLPIL
jgi:hypothetical protein